MTRAGRPPSEPLYSRATMPGDDIFLVKEFGVLVDQGKAAYKAGRYLEAIQAWRKAQAVDPSRRKELDGYLAKGRDRQIAVHLKAGQHFDAAGNEVEAVEEYRKALALDPQDEGLRGQIQERIGSFETQAKVLSGSLLASVGIGYLALVAVAIWIILRMD